MAIKVLIPENERVVSVGGLYQWDFGQALEIECVELGSEIMEVHFACSGMAEAIVRPCTFANGIGTVIIPDQCLEQASSITAWIYSVDSKQGHTVKTITLSVTARTRPSASRDIPAEKIDEYAEALTAINTAVDKLEHGIVTVAKATHAVSADRATTATNAASATYATSAGNATKATGATYAEAILVSLAAPDVSITINNGNGYTTKIFDEGIYVVTYTPTLGGITLSGVGYIGSNDGSLNNYCFSIGKINILYYEVASGAEVSFIYCGDNSDPVISNNGILRFVKISSMIHK